MGGSEGSIENLMAEMQDAFLELATATAELDRVSSHVLAEPRTGSDSSGAVTVTIGVDTLPSAVDIASDWKRRLKGGRLDSAVMDASMTAYMSGWATAFHEVQAEKKRGVPTVLPQIPVISQEARDREPGFAEVWEELQVAVEALEAQELSEPAAPIAQTLKCENGNLSMTVEGGALTACHINEAWAERQPIARLTSSLTGLMKDVRDQASPPPPSHGSPAASMEGVLDDVLGFFNRLAQTDIRDERS
ncbi:hypothetical protein [Mycobacteroides salmoniphilum]|uniref:hypothetical protein n=1 Tax=Mycobacteroides salmoniphilum TaxID=404941 RepID=UPI0012FF7DBC|nr:hypothetical protein [Mycobacteroides salmoniphilum]